MPIQFNQHRTFYSTYGQDREFWGKYQKEKCPDTFYRILMSRGDSILPDKQGLLRIIAEQAYYASGRPYYLVYPCILDLIDRIPDSTTINPIHLPGVPNIMDLGSPYITGMAGSVTKPAKGLVEAAEKAISGMAVKAQCLALRFPEGCDHLSALVCIVTLDDSQIVGIHCNVPGHPGRPGHIIRDSCVNIANDPGANDTLGDLLADITRQDKNESPEHLKKWYRGIRAIACLSMLVDEGLGFLERDLLARDAGRPVTPEVIERAKRNKGLGWSLGAALEATPHTRRPHFAIRHTGPGRRVPLLRPIRGSVVRPRKLTNVPSGFEGKDE